MRQCGNGRGFEMNPLTDKVQEELLHCPFCGGKATLRTEPRIALHNDYLVKCNSCQAQTIVRSNVFATIAAWNTRARSEQGWRPIETAPKDGTVIDVWCSVEKCRFTDCYWHERHNSFVKDHGYPVQTTIFYHEPTHWIFPPSAPEAS